MWGIILFNPETLAHQRSLLVITIVKVEFSSVSLWFFLFRVFHVKFCVFADAFCDLIIPTHYFDA